MSYTITDATYIWAVEAFENQMESTFDDPSWISQESNPRAEMEKLIAVAADLGIDFNMLLNRASAHEVARWVLLETEIMGKAP